MNPLYNVPGLGGYIAGQEQDQQQQQAALQQAQGAFNLRGAMQDRQRQEAFRNELAALGPNPTQEQLTQVSAKYGSPKDVLTTQQASIDRKDAATARAEAQRAALEQRGQEAAARLEQQSRYADQMHEFRMAQAKTAEERAAETARHNKLVEGFQAQNAGVMQELRRLGLQASNDKAAAALGQQKNKQAQALGAAFEKANLPEADATLRAVEAMLEKNPELADWISGPMSATPDALAPKEALEARAAFNKLFNSTLKLRSGAAVTEQELNRLKAEFGVGFTKKPEQVGTAIKQARDIITKHYRSVASGHGSDALNTYNSNMRELGGVPLLEPVESQTTAAPAPGKAKTVKWGDL